MSASGWIYRHVSKSKIHEYTRQNNQDFQLLQRLVVNNNDNNDDDDDDDDDNMQFLYSAFRERFILERAQSALHIFTPGTLGHTNTFSAQQNIQPGYTLQGAAGDQCTLAFSVYCQVFILID